MELESLDHVLVPVGLSVLGAYHFWLLYTILRYPSRTVIGVNAESRHQWVHSMMTVSDISNPSIIQIAVVSQLIFFFQLTKS